MALTLTAAAQLEADKLNIEPQYVLSIEGVTTLYGAVEILKLIQIGDPGLKVDGTWKVGGLNAIEDQEDIIDLSGSSSSINQQLQPDKGSVSSVSSVQVSLVDADNLMTQLITPGLVITDLLGAKAKISMGFRNTAFPGDYVTIFAGIVDDIESGAGTIKINIAHPDQKKRQELFQKVEIELSADLSPSDTTLTYSLVDPARGLHVQARNWEDFSADTSFKTYIKIDDEIIAYTTFPLSTITVTRGALGTTATAHTAGTKGESFIVLEGDLVQLALKLMLSGESGGYINDLQATSFNWISSGERVTNAIFFNGIDLASDYGVTIGDFIYSNSALNSANNYSNVGVPPQKITEVTKTELGSYVVIAGVSFVDESATSGLVTFISKYDTWPVGLAMTPDQVDIEEHEYWQDLLLNAYEYRFYMKDAIQAKDFLETQIYAPYGAYSIPRKGRASMGFHIGPIPRGEIAVLDKDNIRSPDKIKMRRTINRNFYNSIVYAYDEDVLEDKFLSGTVYYNADSQARIPVGNKTLRFDSKGIRADLLGASQTESASFRMLGRYKFAAESFEQISCFFKIGFTIEPGDLILLDPENLQVSNTKDGTRERPSKFYEVINKSMNLKTGDVSLSLVDTNYDSSERYGVISPSSLIVSGTNSYAIIDDSFGEVFPDNEQKKWAQYAGLPVLVHDENYTFSEEVVFTGFDPANRYKMLFQTALSAPVQAGWIIDIPNYPTSTDEEINRKYKLFHAHFSPEVDVTAGVDDFTFTVGAGDIGKFHVDLPVRVHSVDFSTDSDEVIVDSIVGNDVTVKTTLGFTPSAGQKVSFIGFADSEQCYRLI